MRETPLQFRSVQSNGTVTSHIKLLLHWILARVNDYTPLLNLHVLPKPALTIAQNRMFQACGVVNTAHIVLYDRSRKPDAYRQTGWIVRAVLLRGRQQPASCISGPATWS